MTAKNIKVGDRWVTRDCGEVLIVSTTATGPMSIVVEWGLEFYRCFPDGRAHSVSPDDRDLISLAPSTVKREVALYEEWRECTEDVKAFDVSDPPISGWKRISESVAVEFTLLPGESAE